MKNIFTILCLFVFMIVLSFKTSAQDNIELSEAQTYLAQKGEVYFTFNINSRNEIFSLTQIISIDNVRGNQVFAYANAIEFNAFINLGYSYNVLPHPGDATEGIIMHSLDKGIWQFDTYPTYSEYESMMATFAANYPNICKLVEIGTTPTGRKLLAVKISDNVNIREPEPQFLYTSTMHGDETTGYIFMLRLINHLLTNYGTNSEVSSLVNNMEIWINPNANPDGTYAGGNNTVSGATRYNSNNVDLNRNYPGPTSQHPDGSAWQPETIDFMAFADSMNIVLSANFHGGAEVMNYPFDTWTSAQKTHADDAWCQLISHEFADTVHVYSPSRMTDVTANGITNGGDWYVVTGSRQDYMCWFEQGREITIELSSTKLLPATQLNAYWGYYYRSLMNYIKQAGFGFRGIITNSCNGLPLEAKVFVNTHDRDSSYIYSGARFGDYYRPIKAGTYSVTYSANGFVSQTKNITVADFDTTIVNVQLVPVSPVADFTADVTSTCSGTINFSSLTPAVSSWNWNFGDGTTSTLENPTHTYTQNGSYTVSLTVSSCAGNDQLVNTNYITANLAALPVVTNASRCGTGSLTLSATGTGSLYWFDAPSGGNLLAANDTLVTPVLNQTTTYYVESAITQPAQYVGVVSSTTNGAMYNQPTLAWLNFDCLTDINLVSVEVNAATTANREISLYNSAGVKLDSVILNIPTGVSRINLNFHIPPGTNYRLTGSANANMYRSQNALVFPYTLTGVLSITSGGITSTPVNTTRYYFFYNWEVQEIGCISARVPATASISTGPAGGVSQANVTSLCTGNTTTINLSGNTGSSIQWQQSPNGTNSWTNVSGGSGATSSIYTTPVLTSTIFYRAVVSAVGCSDSYSTISQVAVYANPVITTSSANISCFGSANGTAVANVAGGQVPYDFNWSNGGTTGTLLNLNAGIYSVVVTDAFLCTATASITVTEPAQLNVYTNVTDATCGNANGSATAISSGGTGAVGMQWSNSTAGSLIQNVLAGTYFVTVTDANGCIDTDTAVINNIAQFSANVQTTSLLCHGDITATATAFVTGGADPITYFWTNGSFTSSVSGLGAGLVSVTITDNNNCSTVLTETITEPEAIIATVNTISTTCGLNNGTIEAVASGGTGILSYLWSNDATTAVQTNIAAGLYDVSITDGNSCVNVYSGLVNAIPVVGGNIVTQSVSCNGGSNGSAVVVASDGTPPYTYYWSTGSSLDQVSSLPAGNITVTITDYNGCATVITDAVSQPQPIITDLVITPESFAGANDGSVITNVSGGTSPYNYSWSNGSHSNSITGVPAGTYSLAIIDAHGCFYTTPVVIDVLISVTENNIDQMISVFPNPAKNFVDIYTTKQIVKIELITVTGQVVYTSENLSKHIDVSQLSDGLYVIRYTLGNGFVELNKFIISR